MLQLFIYEVKEPNLKLYVEIKLTSVEGRETHSFFLQKNLILMSCHLIHTRCEHQVLAPIWLTFLHPLLKQRLLGPNLN